MGDRLYIGGLDRGYISRDNLMAHFSQYGELSEVHIPVSEKMAFGFVAFVDDGVAQAVAGMTHTLKGVTLDVKMAKSKGKLPTGGQSSLQMAPAAMPAFGVAAGYTPPEFQVKPPADDGCRLHIGNLDHRHISQEDLLQYFSQFGQVTEVYIPVRMKTNDNAKISFGFVSFGDPVLAQSVANMPSHVVKGVTLDVKMAKRPAAGLPQASPSTAATENGAKDTDIRLHIGNLDHRKIAPADLWSYFNQFGKVTEVHIPHRRKTTASSKISFGFVSYEDLTVAIRVVNMLHVLNGVELKVTMSGGARPEGAPAHRKSLTLQATSEPAAGQSFSHSLPSDFPDYGARVAPY